MKKQKIRRDIKIAKVIALSLIILLSVFSACYLMFGNFFNRSVVVFSNLNNNFSYNYKINTKANDFVDYSDNKNYTAYVTDLIDNVDLEFKYKFEDTSYRESEIKYKYSITGKLFGYYNKNSEEQKIIERDYEILPPVEKTAKGNMFTIDERFDVDVQPLNQLINNFKLEQDMLISSTYDITLNIEIEGVSREKISYSPNISIEIGGKTTKINGENNRNDNMTVDSVEQVNLEGDNLKYVIVLGIISLLAIIRLIYILFFTDELVVIKNVYKAEVNEIIRSCQDKIVVVNNLPIFENKHVIEVDYIEEIVKLSEELYKPILCYENDDETVTQFIVVSDETVYKFIIYKR